MIAYLRGTIRHLSEKSAILEAHGVGYEVALPADLMENLQIGSPLELFTHAVYREDEAALFGFDSIARRELFRTLLTVNGVGAKMGMELMSLPSDKLQAAIANGDEAYLTLVKGVGAKLASRLVLELKGKMNVLPISGKGSLSGDSLQGLEDAITALEHLGYDRRQINRVLKDLPKETTTTEDVVRWALKVL